MDKSWSNRPESKVQASLTLLFLLDQFGQDQVIGTRLCRSMAKCTLDNNSGPCVLLLVLLTLAACSAESTQLPVRLERQAPLDAWRGVSERAADVSAFAALPY